MGLDYIEREDNQLADALSKDASAMRTFESDLDYFKIVYRLEDLLRGVKLNKRSRK